MKLHVGLNHSNLKKMGSAPHCLLINGVQPSPNDTGLIDSGKAALYLQMERVALSMSSFVIPGKGLIIKGAPESDRHRKSVIGKDNPCRESMYFTALKA